ncbi:MAG: hypothetical protein KDC92_07170 [Bacteroidetes bacterium]|nr:hypothetical protein [Bacteroidota bacterium]
MSLAKRPILVFAIIFSACQSKSLNESITEDGQIEADSISNLQEKLPNEKRSETETRIDSTDHYYKVEFDTFRLKQGESHIAITSESLIFPIVRTGNARLDETINQDVKKRYSRTGNSSETLESALSKLENEGIVYHDFSISLNNYGLLSFQINYESCGAYCTSWTEYFNYSTSTGKWLTLNDILDTAGEFRNRVYEDIKNRYSQQKTELLEMLNDPESELDSSTYQWALDCYNDCEKAFKLKTFTLHPKRLEVIHQCYLPNAIKYLTPAFNLYYNYSEIKEHSKVDLK